MDSYVYIGPYIEYKPKDKTKSVNKTILTCSDLDCVEHKKKISKGKYCAECGSAIEMMDVEIIKTSPIEFWDILEEMGDEDIFHYVEGIPNILVCNTKNDYCLSVESGEVKIINDVPQSTESITKFISEYKKELQAFERLDMIYDVKFGLISYYS